jgi:hypothetical protein
MAVAVFVKSIGLQNINDIIDPFFVNHHGAQYGFF